MISSNKGRLFARIGIQQYPSFAWVGASAAPPGLRSSRPLQLCSAPFRWSGLADGIDDEGNGELSFG